MPASLVNMDGILKCQWNSGDSNAMWLFPSPTHPMHQSTQSASTGTQNTVRSKITPVNRKLPGTQATLYRYSREDAYDSTNHRLINESSSVFIELQSAMEENVENEFARQEVLHRFSIHYRSILQACILSLNNNEENRKVRDEFYNMHLIWELCEIMMVERPTVGVVLSRLLELVAYHCPESGQISLALASLDKPESHHEYWNTIYSLVFQGNIKAARDLLARHEHFQTTEFQTLDQLMLNMPFHKLFREYSQPEFLMRWGKWRSDCHVTIQMRRFGNNLNLEIICRILAGDDNIFSHLRQLFHGKWWYLLVSKMVYCNPTVTPADLRKYAEESMSILSKSTHELDSTDRIIVAILEYHVPEILTEIITKSKNFWLSAHLSDLLFHSCQGPIDEENESTAYIREYFLREYASGLLLHHSLWQIGPIYLEFCPLQGQELLACLLQKVPLDTERKANKVLSICRQYNLDDLYSSVCKVMAVRALHCQRLGAALSWAIKCQEANFISYLAVKYLDDYAMNGKFLNLDLLDRLGELNIFTQKLSFLGEYRQFHKLVGQDKMKEAGVLLISLLAESPERFWKVLLIDALPLLKSGKNIMFDTTQTYEMMAKVEQLISDDPTTYIDSDQRDWLRNIRSALSENLARASVIELQPQQQPDETLQDEEDID